MSESFFDPALLFFPHAVPPPAGPPGAFFDPALLFFPHAVPSVVGLGEIMVVIRGTPGALERRVLIDAADQKRVVITSINKVVVVQDDVAPPIKVVP